MGQFTTSESRKLATESSAGAKREFPIVGIGASAGGLDPIRELLEDLPTDTGMSFVVIQHLAPGQESMLPEILSRSTKMNVLQVQDGMKIEKNQVYVITPGNTLTLKDGCLKVVPKGIALKPINDFMISLASEQKNLSIGVVLSGTGNDGTEGLKAIKAEGGITLVQDPETAQYADMPRNAIFAETAYFVLSPKNIAEELVRLSKNPQLTHDETESLQQTKGETSLRKILIMLKNAFGVDFTHYKETTINRRIARRMVINKIENDKEYATFLRATPNELNALFDDLLIGVTSFFRETKTFEALKEKVFPELIKNRSPDESIRVWVPGCSTGEEVYSLALAIQEFLEEKTIPNLRVQIFGTDANEKNVEKARQGLYPKSIEEKVSESRLKRFFSRQNGNYQITKRIRDICIFAKQDITSDPPFSNLDLIMCRNVLIYFDSLLHERVFPIFHYGLKENRFLVIGESESVGKFSYLFEPVTTKGLIFRKKRAQPQTFLHSQTFVPYSLTQKTVKQPEKPSSMVLLKEEVDHLLLAEYAPATLLVNNNLEILVFRGQVDPYLTHESGTASFSLTKIIRKELRTDVQTAVYRARKENKAIKETVQFKHDGQQKTVTIKVKPLKTVDFEEPFFLITFEEKASSHKLSQQVAESISGSAEKDIGKESQVQELKKDLESTKQSLQTIIEVQEATNEELRSTMEEAQSSNEELQSTNEELETAKEELQSSNEELQTLNEELKNRNFALGRLNDDLTNLQTNTNISVVIVDRELKIRRFTASAQELLEISPSDIGRPITSINLGVHIIDLDKIITDVITKLSTANQEVANNKDRLFEMQIRPYLTEEKKIDGAVLSFTEITERKKNEELFKKNKEQLEAIITNAPIGIATTDSMNTIQSANESFCKIIGFSQDELKKLTFKDFTHPDDIKESIALMEELSSGRISFFSREKRYIRKDGKIIYGRIIVNAIRDNKKPTFYVAELEDITERRRLLEELEGHTKNLEMLVEERTKQLKDAERLAAIGSTAGMVGHDIRNPLQAMISDAYLLRSELTSMPDCESKEGIKESLDSIEMNIAYVDKIVSDLQDYTRPLKPNFQEVNVKDLIISTLTIAKVPERIETQIDVDERFIVNTDATYFKRVLANLIINAVQATPNEGILTIEAYKKYDKTIINIKDTGGGIPEKVKPNLFSPLFTTKSKGQGLGLAVVKRLVEGLNGKVSFESKEGKGTKFTIELPA
jgi:two-component system, chemotaxis family, CheB/CheR fusion protein